MQEKDLLNLILSKKTHAITHFLFLLHISVDQSFTEEIVLDAAIKLAELTEIKCTKHLSIVSVVPGGLLPLSLSKLRAKVEP